MKWMEFEKCLKRYEAQLEVNNLGFDELKQQVWKFKKRNKSQLFENFKENEGIIKSFNMTYLTKGCIDKEVIYLVLQEWENAFRMEGSKSLEKLLMKIYGAKKLTLEKKTKLVLFLIDSNLLDRKKDLIETLSSS